MFLDLSSQCPNLSIFLLNNRIESFALLGKYLYLVFALSAQSLVAVLEFCQSLPQFIVFSTDVLELVLQFAQLTGRKPQVFLCVSHFFTHVVVFSDEFLNANFVGL